MEQDAAGSSPAVGSSLFATTYVKSESVAYTRFWPESVHDVSLSKNSLRSACRLTGHAIPEDAVQGPGGCQPIRVGNAVVELHRYVNIGVSKKFCRNRSRPGADE